MTFLEQQQEEAEEYFYMEFCHTEYDSEDKPVIRFSNVDQANEAIDWVRALISQVVQNTVVYALEKCTEDGKINECNYLKDLLTKLVNNNQDVGSGQQA